ncbi:MAG: glycoside hydrolase family 3 protein [Candidatus Eisenbacteria bacterium]|nr:glycoside hydrolase family 3 protein [Candidatus Eisenbacteria bacterium]
MRYSELSLDEKLGQMFLVGIGDGTEAEINLLKETIHPGGYILFERNLKSSSSLGPLVNFLAKEKHGRPFPFITCDQEGGIISPLRQVCSWPPSQMAVSATGSKNAAYLSAFITGGRLSALGFNMNLSPVLDVNVNPMNPVIGVRSFGDRPSVALELGTEFIRGLEDGGVLSVAKHFPGHGSSETDSHLGLPAVPERESLDGALLPFRECIGKGVDGIMVGHIHCPSLDREKIASTLSKNVVQGQLRQKLGFEKIVITDAMEMKALAGLSEEEASLRAIDAGCDILLFAESGPKLKRVFDFLLDSVRSGRIKEERIEASCVRIAKAKGKASILRQRKAASREKIVLAEGLSGDDFFSNEVEDALRDIHSSSITVLRDPMRNLELEKDLADADSWLLERPGEDSVTQPALAGLREAGFRCNVISRESSPRSFSNRMTLLFTAGRKPISSSELKILSDVSASRTNVTSVSLVNPYDAGSFPKNWTVILTYGFEKLSLHSLRDVVLGKSAAKGQLPVSIAA